ncbi:MAG: hypothetical protein E7515_09005 [Ruminococcaceae bacterium]|nr:hypothetical protein [Oscillospiraceae bacterium]
MIDAQNNEKSLETQSFQGLAFLFFIFMIAIIMVTTMTGRKIPMNSVTAFSFAVGFVLMYSGTRVKAFLKSIKTPCTFKPF